MASNKSNRVCSDAGMIDNDTRKEVASNESNEVCSDAGRIDKHTNKRRFLKIIEEGMENTIKDFKALPRTIELEQETLADFSEEQSSVNYNYRFERKSIPPANSDSGWSYEVFHVESSELQVVAREGFDPDDITVSHHNDVLTHNESNDDIATGDGHRDGTCVQNNTTGAEGTTPADRDERQQEHDERPTCESGDLKYHERIHVEVKCHQDDTCLKNGCNEATSEYHGYNGDQIIGKSNTFRYGITMETDSSSGHFVRQVCPDNKREVAVQCELPAPRPVPTDAKPYQCLQCFKTFVYKWSLKGHERVHTGVRPYKCKHCEKTFTKQDFLDKHERIHTGFKPYVCKYCERAFTQESNLTVHERIHTGVKPYNCQHCNKAFAQRSSLKTHERTHTGVRPYQCSICNKAFAHQGNLKEHERIHTGFKPYECSYCKKAFTARSNLDLHKRIHTGVKPHKCGHCEKTFLRQGNLEAHERTHTGVKPFKCKHCDKAFAQQGNVEKHERIHTGVRPFSCALCNKEFSQHSHLKVHQRVHTGEKPYLCKHCDMAFAFAGRFKKHVLSHNMDA